MNDKRPQEIDSLDGVKLKPYELGISIQTSGILALVLAGIVYYHASVRLFHLGPVPALVASIVPLLLWMALSIVNRIGLLDRDQAVAIVQAHDGDLESFHRQVRAMDAQMRADMKRLGIRVPVELLFVRYGSPYTFWSVYGYRVVLSLDWMRELECSSDDMQSMLCKARAIVLHELGHIYNKDHVFIDLTNTFFYGTIGCLVSQLMLAMFTDYALSALHGSLLVVLIFQYFYHAYLARRRESFADMVSIATQQTMLYLQEQLGNPALLGDSRHRHGGFGFLAHRFVSNKAPSVPNEHCPEVERGLRGWVAHTASRATRWFGLDDASARYFAPDERVDFLQAACNFALLRKRDFFLLGLVAMLIPYFWLMMLASYGFAGLGLGLGAFPVISFLCYRTCVGDSLVSNATDALHPWRRARYFLLGGILGQMAALWPMLAAGSTPLVRFYLTLVILWTALVDTVVIVYCLEYCIKANIVGSLEAYIRATRRFSSSWALVSTLGKFWVAILVFLFTAVLYNYMRGDPLPLDFVIPVLGILVVLFGWIPYRLMREELRYLAPSITHSYNWLCPHCREPNQVRAVHWASNPVIIPEGLKRACQSCHVLAMTELIVIIDDSRIPATQGSTSVFTLSAKACDQLEEQHRDLQSAVLNGEHRPEHHATWSVLILLAITTALSTWFYYKYRVQEEPWPSATQIVQADHETSPRPDPMIDVTAWIG